MSNSKSISFFLICSSITTDFLNKRAEATLYLRKWTFSQDHLPVAMIFEGINQFACTLAMELYPDAHADFYVPNIIEEFYSEFDVSSPEVTISGWAENKHGLCRVVCEIQDPVTGRNVSSAVVLVNKAHSYNQRKTLTEHASDANMLSIDIFPQSHPETEAFEVCFNAKHPLFQEHFPGHPIVPGSILFETAFKNIKYRYPDMRKVIMKKIKFIKGVIPDVLYVLQLRTSGDLLNKEIIISYTRDGQRYASGKLCI